MQYFDLIFTIHAQGQMRDRGIKIEDAWKTFKYPTQTRKGKKGHVEFDKEFDDFKITVLAHQNMKNEWIAVSAWRTPPLPGTADAKRKTVWKKYNKSGFFGKLWIELKQQLGF